MGPPRLQLDHRSARQLPPQTFEERAFVDAYCGAGRYNVERAAEVIGVQAKRGWDLYSRPRIRKAITAKLKGRTLSGAAINAELSDMAAAAFRPGRDPKTGKPTAPEIDPRDKAKALELLMKAKGIGRDRALILLERLMIAEHERRRGRLETAGVGPEGAQSVAVLDVSPVSAETALAEGADLAAAAREREAIRKEAEHAAPTSTTSPETQLALPLSAPKEVK